MDVSKKAVLCTLLLPAAMMLGSCGGGGADSLTPTPPQASAKVGGVVTGSLGNASLTLANNGGDSVTVSSTGTFVFPATLNAGASFNVTLAGQPAGAVCRINNASGQIDAHNDNVGTVWVFCQEKSGPSMDAENLTAVVSGLDANNTVTLNIANYPVVVSTSGTYTFSSASLAIIALYASVSANPQNHACTVTDSTISSGSESVIQC